jgi:hypothetical protein
MKKRFLGVIGVLLVSVFLSCDNGTTDTWTDVISLDQIDGTWKGSSSQTMTIQELVVQLGQTWDGTMETLFGDMIATIDIDLTTTIDAGNGTQTVELIQTEIYSGGNIAAIWTSGSFKTTVEQLLNDNAVQNGNTVQFEWIDANHSITITTNTGPNSINIGDMAGVKINQTGTQVIVPAGRIYTGSPPMTLTRQ